MSEKIQYIFGAMFALSNRLQILGDKLDDKMTVKQWFLIAIILSFNTEPTVSQVASKVGSSRQNVKKMAEILYREGFLNMEKDNFDNRIIRLSITEKCMQYFAKRENKEKEFLQKIFNDIDEKSLSHVFSVFKKIEQNIIAMEKQNEKEE